MVLPLRNLEQVDVLGLLDDILLPRVVGKHQGDILGRPRTAGT